MKILHFADMHIRGSHLPEIKKCVDFMIDTAISEKPDLIINSGDTFNSFAVQLDSEAARYAMDVHKRLADIAPVSVIIGTPSHDGKAAVAFGHINSKFPIHVTADAPEQLFLFQGELFTKDKFMVPAFTGIPEAIISCFPAPTKKWFQSPDSILSTEKQIAQGLAAIIGSYRVDAERFPCPHILTAHWNVTGSLISDTQSLTGVDIEVSKDQMALGGFNLICLGHIHKQQKIGENAFFPGSTQNNTFGEMDTKGFYFHEISGYAVQSNFVPTPTTRMIKIDGIDWRRGINHDDYAMLHDSSIYDYSRVRLTIKVFVDEYESMDVPRIKKFFDDHEADLTLNIVRMPRENVRSERLQDLDRLYDKIKENAAVLGEAVPEGIELRADMLEMGNTDKLIKNIKSM